jgi:hypothetical protein
VGCGRDAQNGPYVGEGRDAGHEGDLPVQRRIFGGEKGQGRAGRESDQGHPPAFGVGPRGDLVRGLRGGVHGPGGDPVFPQARQVGHDREVAGPRETLRQVPNRRQLSSLWHGPVDHEHDWPRSLPRRFRDQRRVSRDPRVGEVWVSARHPDGRGEDRSVEDGGDHHHGTRLGVHP